MLNLKECEGAKISDDLPLFNVKYSDIQRLVALEEDEIIAI